MDYMTYILSFTEGVLTFVSPCILPMLPIYFFYLAGLSSQGGEAQVLTGKHRLLLNSVAFVMGFTLVFTALGATATSIGLFLKNHLDFLRKAGGIVMIVFGLNYLGIFKLKILNMEKRFNVEFKELKFFNSILFGVVFGFAWTPCLTAFLGSILIMAGNSDTVLQGMLLLLVYSAGLGLPFLIVSLIFENAREVLRNIQKYGRIINLVSGMVLILAGILVYTDTLKKIGSWWIW